MGSTVAALYLAVSCSASGTGKEPTEEPFDATPSIEDDTLTTEFSTGGSQVTVEPAAGGSGEIPPSSGGVLRPIDAPTLSEDEEPHPLLGAGAYPSRDLTDPCAIAQHWELEVVLDMSPGALILKDGVVWEVTGIGVEHGWTMDMNAPPCLTANTDCDDLVYEEVITCPE